MLVKRLKRIRSFFKNELALLCLAGILIIAAGQLTLWTLSNTITSSTFIAAYQRASLQVKKTGNGHLLISKKTKEGSIRRDLYQKFFSRKGSLLVPGLVLAAIVAGLLMKCWQHLFRLRYRDKIILPTLLILAGIGLLSIIRLSIDIPHTWPSRRFPSALDWPFRQAVSLSTSFLIIPLTALAGTFLEKTDWLQPAMTRKIFGRLPAYTVFPACALLIMITTGIMGRHDFSHSLSLHILGGNFQIVEFIKPLLVFFMAYLLTELDKGNKIHHNILGISLNLKHLYLFIATSAIITFTSLFCTRDLGLTIICIGFLVAAIVIGTGEGIIIAGTLLLLGGAVYLIISHQSPVHAFRRIIAVADPFHYSEALSRVRWCFAAGGLYGTGPGKGMPFDVKNADSDFILAAIAEEMGFVGVTVVILGLACIIYRGILIARREEDPFRKHLAAGIVILFMLQSLVIIGGNLGVVPLTGLPLFFVARGGMGCIINALLIGILLQISFFYQQNIDTGIPPYMGRWQAVNRRLNMLAWIFLALIFLLWIRAGYLMLYAAADDFTKPFVDKEKLALFDHLIDKQVFRIKHGSIIVDYGNFPAAAKDLPPSPRARISISQAKIDTRNLASYVKDLKIKQGQPAMPPWKFNISNPRLKRRMAYDIVDRRGKKLATTIAGIRRYPQKEAAFPVVGHCKAGTSMFLEKDINSLVASIYKGHLGLLNLGWKSIFDRLLTLLKGSIPARTEPEKLSVVTTIDSNVQKKAMALLKNRKGAVIAMSIPDGALIALVSRPSFNPDQPENIIAWDKAFSNQRLKLKYNRAIHVRYPPGSVFKLLTGAAILESGKKFAEKKMFCRGFDRRLQIKDAGYLKTRRGHGRVDFNKAMALSCNIYFARQAVDLGTKIQEIAAKLGFSSTITLAPWDDNPDLQTVPSHVLTCYSVSGSGEIPGECKNKARSSTSFISKKFLDNNPKLVARAGIGQTVVEATPLQILLLTAAVANEGKVPTPYLVEEITSVAGGKTKEVLWSNFPRLAKRAFSRNTASKLTKAMEQVYAYGTAGPRVIPLRLDKKGGQGGAYGLRRKPLSAARVAAKTGTAEVESQKSHAWFVAFAPADKPRVAVVVLVENGGSGGSTAGPIGMIILRDSLRALAKK